MSDASEPRPVEEGEILLAKIGTPQRDILVAITSVKGEKISGVGHLGYCSMSFESTWKGAAIPEDWRRVTVEDFVGEEVPA